MNFFSTRRRWLAAALVILTALFVGLGIRCFNPPSPPPPAVVVFPLPYQIPRQKVPLPDRWIPRSWGWAWRAKEAVFGRAKPITLWTTVFEITGQEATALAQHLPPVPAFAGTNGLRIWIVGESEKAVLQGSIPSSGYRLVSSPRMSTADGMQAMLSSGKSVPMGASQMNVGLVLGFLPRIHSDVTDLITVITCSEAVTNPPNVISIRTNFTAAARIQIPSGSWVFLLDTAEGSNTGKRTGVLISPNVPKPKK